VAFVDRFKNIDDLQLNPNTIALTRDLNQVREPVIYFNNTQWNFTHDYVLRWLKGKCKEVILIGCADFENQEHYNDNSKFLPCETNIKNSINFIENEASQWFKIYKMNTRGILNIPVWSKNA